MEKERKAEAEVKRLEKLKKRAIRMRLKAEGLEEEGGLGDISSDDQLSDQDPLDQDMGTTIGTGPGRNYDGGASTTVQNLTDLRKPKQGVSRDPTSLLNQTLESK